MRGVAQGFHRLQPDITYRMTRRHHVHHDNHPARLENTFHLTQRPANVMPVVSGVAANHHIKAGISERQRFGVPCWVTILLKPFSFAAAATTSSIWLDKS